MSDFWEWMDQPIELFNAQYLVFGLVVYAAISMLMLGAAGRRGVMRFKLFAPNTEAFEQGDDDRFPMLTWKGLQLMVLTVFAWPIVVPLGLLLVAVGLAVLYLLERFINKSNV